MGWKAVKTIMPTSPPGKETGFSLFELIAVLFILGIAAALVLPSFSGGLTGINLETSARDIVTHMRQARSEAVSRQTVHRIIVLPHEDPSEPYEYVLADEYEKALRTYPLPEGISFRIEDPANPPMVSFYPNGRSSGGTLILVAESGREMVVEADPITGFGRVLKDESEN